MVGYSVILPHTCAPDVTCALTRSLASVLGPLARRFEILIVAEPSSRADCEPLRQQLAGCEGVSLWRLVAARGIDAAVVAALGVCQYDTVVAMDPAAGFSALDVPRLLERLSRHDMVLGRQRLTGAARLWERLRRIALPLSATHYDEGSLFWAATREALPSSPVPRGAMRRLPLLVARRGYRVDQFYVSQARRRHAARRTRQNLLDVLATWWLAGREHRAHCEPLREAPGSQMRIDAAHPTRGAAGPTRARDAQFEQQ